LENVKEEILNSLKNIQSLVVFTTKGARKRKTTNIFEVITKELKMHYEYFYVDEYPNFRQINELNKLNKNFDAVVSIGGGSVIDLAKIFSLTTSDKKVNSINDLKIREKKIFHITIPTTSGSGAEETIFATIWDRVNLKKYSFENKNLKPDTVFLIPELTASMSSHLTITTGLDAICHCVDSILSKAASSDSYELANSGLKLLTSNLELVINNPSNLEARTKMLLGSNLAGKVINKTRTSITHSISYPLTNYYNLDHGLACGFSLMEVVDINKNKFIEIGIDNLHDRLFSIFENLEIKKIFQQHIKEIDIENISENVLSNKRSSNYYKSLDRERTEEIIYNSAKKYGIEVI
tara:strand:+ start:3359 stop:4411 length:1053 start_codon:yes stop_codon:yes gene_type:complete